ncbi:hypothetical protein PanWU01x14_009710 [Parasponia andersonii]|uniref:Uncharacterized protein n=1 Tax=Parasponia andersonii TaxID=3476 RepID=A0A2P5E2G8_PARAD|nr:hypothetical protein PanWU01x14_009710 [Parasponia andersonii]
MNSVVRIYQARFLFETRVQPIINSRVKWEQSAPGELKLNGVRVVPLTIREEGLLFAGESHLGAAITERLRHLYGEFVGGLSFSNLVANDISSLLREMDGGTYCFFPFSRNEAALYTR